MAGLLPGRVSGALAFWLGSTRARGRRRLGAHEEPRARWVEGVLLGVEGRARLVTPSSRYGAAAGCTGSTGPSQI